ncbi:MAG: flagellar export protein FliJ [Gammaproteobacteria bacterium]|nr:flagellar export protein FliJ [Gammaproteobacteria bacterium]
MKKSDRMIPIKQLAEDHEKEAVKDLGQAQRALTEHEMKLEQLVSYRAEYYRMFQEHGSRGMDGSQLQAYQSFLAQLDTAIVSQREMIEQVSVERDNRRDVWQHRHIRTEALGKTVERYQNTEQRQEQSREQREQDDHANNQFWLLHHK